MALLLHRSRAAAPDAAADGVAPAAPGPVVETVPARRVYARPTGAAITGLTALVVGAWGAVASYIGPYFGFRPVDDQVWVGSLQNGLLHLLPGCAAAAAGLMLIGMGPARRSIRGALLLPALLLAAAGAWFVIGPPAWPTFESGAAFHQAVSPLRNLLNVACSSYGPGLLLVLLAGMAMKAGTTRPIPVEDPMMPAEAASRAGRRVAAPATGTTATGTSAPAPTTTTAVPTEGRATASPATAPPATEV